MVSTVRPPRTGAKSAHGAGVRVGIVGLGAIGAAVAGRLSRGDIPGVELVGAASRDPAKARAALDRIGATAPVLELAALADAADVVIECAPASVLGELGRAVLSAGKKLMVLSVGALLDHPEL